MTRSARAVVCVLAPNPGPMTLAGTNTWVLGDPALGPTVVVDPGPDEAVHRERVLDVAGERVETVLLTHRHLDHSEGAAAFARRAGCPVRAADPAWRTGPDGLDEGDVLEHGGVRLEVLATPGHTSDSISLLVTRGGPAGTVADLLTGDTVLGTGSTVITHPDGDLGAYLDSLDRLLEVVVDRGVRRILPGHGPVVDDPEAVLRAYRRHRLDRLGQVREAVDAGATTPEQVLTAVYPEVVGTRLERAAAQSVRAQLDYLEGHRSR